MSSSRNAPCPCGSGRKYKHCHGADATRPRRAGSADRQPSLERARNLHQAGYLPEAEALYREILERSPRNADAMNMFGILCAQRGDQNSALEWIGKAIAVDSRNAAYRFNFGKALLQLRRPREACEALERSVSLDPGNADAYNELGLARAETGSFEAAEKAFRRALSLQPRHWEAHNNLGLLLHRLGRGEEAILSLRRALELEPRSAESLRNLGLVLRAQGRAGEAVEACRAAADLNPGDPATLTNLGNALGDLSRDEEAIGCFRDAVAAAPEYADAHYNWGSLCLRSGRFREAADRFRAALAIDPRLAEAESGLASSLHDLGEVEGAIAACRRALQLRPEDTNTHSQLLFSLLHSSEVGLRQVFDEHREWSRRHVAGYSSHLGRHANSREPERRLRIGYVSGDFRHHSVAQFFEPVLASHDRAGFEIFCYYNLSRADQTTERLRRSAGQWREIASLGDDAVADRVRADRIDILVDLSGHTKFNRLPVFARKPAPVQATWLGYLNTTGLSAIDYRITDGRASPEGLLDEFHTERIIRLPDSQWCYQAPSDCPDVMIPPAIREGKPVTFGAFSSLAKIGPRVIALWCALLERLPGARLLVMGLGLESMRDEYLSRFASRGAAAQRVDLRGFQSFHDYLAAHGAVDAMLDTFPYTGGTTTCHALWMGVPVISLAGDSGPSRGGASVLGTIGLDELLAHTPEQYLDKACSLANDPERLAELRAGMRGRMSVSPLMDSARFTRNLEDAYRSMWRQWCKERT
ncbi:MAG TPA: tetratricopeptide repeat protein [Burkholderiales bacterium]|nr:tetratricopeptide repeat protein [Burkholderiales bacterium]